MKVNETAYLQLIRVNEQTNWPERYYRDLFLLDCKTLGCYPEHFKFWELPDGWPFGWILRDSGTWLVQPDEPLDNNMASAYYKEFYTHHRWVDVVRRSRVAYGFYGRDCEFSPTDHMYWWWDGETLMQVPSPATILDRMIAWQEANLDKIRPRN